MHTESKTVIDAPLERVFEVTSNLENWVPLLPHYRWIRFSEKSGDGLRSRVAMACWRGVIPISWESVHEVRPDVPEVVFTHLRAFTKGMVVRWSYAPQDDGRIAVAITHELRFRLRPLAWLAEPVISRGFIEPVARKTLATFKQLLEQEAQGGPAITTARPSPTPVPAPGRPPAP